MKQPIISLLITSTLVISACPQADVSTEIATFESVEHGCVVSAACGVQPRADVSNCINYYFDVLIGLGQGPLYAQIYRCVREARSDCDAVKRCYGETETCTQDSFKAYCDGSRAFTCDLLDKKVYSLDCGLVGMTCQPMAQQPFAATCACDSSFSPRCVGSYAVSCKGGQPQAQNCASSDLTCQNGHCIPGGPKSCMASASDARCHGNVATHCSQDGVMTFRDCSAGPTYRRCDKGRRVRQPWTGWDVSDHARPSRTPETSETTCPRRRGS